MNYKEIFESVLKEGNDSTYYAALDIENTESLYNAAQKVNSAKGLEKAMLRMKSEFPDAKKIKWNEVDWKKVLYDVLDESVIEEQQEGTDAEYDAFFAKLLKDEYGVEDIEDLSKEDKKEFFSTVEKKWKADNE